MLAGGITPKQLRQAGYKHAELVAAGVPLADLKAAGFKAKDANLKATGSKLQNAGHGHKQGGVIKPQNAGHASGHEQGGVTASDLLSEGGYTAKELVEAGVVRERQRSLASPKPNLHLPC